MRTKFLWLAIGSSERLAIGAGFCVLKLEICKSVS